MSLFKVPFGIVFASVVLSTVPAFADTAVVLDNNQNTVITGNNNNATNISNQSANVSTRGGGGTGVSIRSNQSCDIAGNNNTCVNRNTQQAEVRNTERPGFQRYRGFPRYGH